MSAKSMFWVEMVCSECSIVGYGRWVSGNRIPVMEFKLEAKERGWMQDILGEFVCGRCTIQMIDDAKAGRL